MWMFRQALISHKPQMVSIISATFHCGRNVASDIGETAWTNPLPYFGHCSPAQKQLGLFGDLLLSLFLLVQPNPSTPRHKCLSLVALFVIGWLITCPSLLCGDPDSS